MCFELDSVPPIPALSGGAPVRSEDLTLDAADGTRFAAFAALPDEHGPAGVVILPDVRGLYRFYEELALRFAERGYAAVAFDYFGRTAGVAQARRRLPVHGARRADDARGRAGRTRGPRSSTCARPRVAAARSIFTVGFCFGGRNSWLAAAGGHGLAGAIGFYGVAGRAQRPAGADAARRGAGRADPGAPGRRRRQHHRRGQRGLRRGAHGRRRRARASSPTTARRTASSTGATRSSPTPRPTPGSACSRSSSATRPGADQLVMKLIRRWSRACCGSVTGRSLLRPAGRKRV